LAIAAAALTAREVVLASQVARRRIAAPAHRCALAAVDEDAPSATSYAWLAPSARLS
jgi:hypothetical protein